jgi:hypothetical protein
MECPNGCNPKERQRERQREKRGIKTRYEEKNLGLFRPVLGKYHLYSSGGRFSLLGIQNRQVRG